MKLSVTFKLCVAFVALTAAVLAATLSLARWSFEAGFLEYVNALEQVRLERVRDRLVARYDPVRRGWDEVTLLELLDLGPLPGPPHDRPPPDRPPPDRPPPGPDRRFGPPGHPGPPGPLPRTALFDADGTLLAGQSFEVPAAAELRLPVLIDGLPVAELVSVPQRQLAAAPGTAFSAQQLRASILIGAVALLAALLVSLALARAFVAPLRRALAGVNTLAQGDYDHRLDEVRGDEIGLLMRDLDRLGETLAGNRTARNRWIADISHELRTPVAVLSAELDAVRDGVRMADAEQIESFAEEVGRLRKLIDDLYELSLADLGGLRYEFAEVDLARLVGDLAASFGSRADAADFSLGVTTPDQAIVEADARRIEQLLVNLLENTLAYTDAPGQAQVTLKQMDGHWCLEVEDSAPGVPADECPRLFESLYRREASRSRRAGGAGLGLAICRNIAEAHGGTIAAMPSGLGGLKVQVTFWSDA